MPDSPRQDPPPTRPPLPDPTPTPAGVEEETMREAEEAERAMDA